MSEQINNYTNDSIQSFADEIEAIRQRPASIGIESHNSLFTEVLANSIDESREGFGKLIEVIKHKDLSITIKDLGRGIPLGKDSSGKYTYQRVLCKLWSGGKMNNNDEEGGYLYSLGVNGCGLKATNFCSDLFQCTSFRDSKKYFIEYQKGRQQCELQEEKYNYENTGTIITWKPSAEVFRTGDNTDKEFITTMLKQQAIVNAGLKFTFKDESSNVHEEFYYEHGIVDFIKEYSSDKNISDIILWNTETEGKDKTKDNTDNEYNQNYKIKCNIAFAFNNENQLMNYYHNGSYLENGGTPEDFIKNAFVYSIDKYLKENNIYEKKDKKIKFDDVTDSLIIISDTYSTISLYTDQAKKKIDSELMKTYMTNYLREQLNVYFIENPLEAKKICSTILNNARANLKAEKSKQDIKKKLSEKVDNMSNRVEGLIDCKYHNEESELFICEGKSAMGSIILSRNPNNQAGVAIRGKILSCLKASYQTIFTNQVVVDLIKIMGCGVEVKSKHNKDLNSFDINKLRYNKIILASDSDFDGENIQVLLLTMIYRLMPELIKQGKVYIAQTPKFVIKNKDEKYYAFTDDEKDKIVSKLNGKISVNYLKGLGELSEIDMYNTALNPETRYMIKVTIGDVEKMIEKFELWMSNDVAPRKAFIENHLHEYINDEE